jgi:hypothetical protein
MMMNVMGLFICVVNYAKLYNVFSDHMRLYMGFMQMLMPKIINVPDELKPSVEKTLNNLGNMTPTTYFETFEEVSQLLPKLNEETLTDLKDILDFYAKPLVDSDAQLNMPNHNACKLGSINGRTRKSDDNKRMTSRYIEGCR